ncbi:MAG TPA: DsbA family oxidoreductase [Spirochaetia bacterium]|nr:DsbA family oxidoreductase [Spirochaetia bacterium]
MHIEVWSDVVCPWCYIGKRRLESAIRMFEHGDEVEISWRSFELNPESPQRDELPLENLLAEKYGMSLDDARAANERVSNLAAAEGLEYHLDRAHSANSFNAHRLIHFAATHGKQALMKERLLRAHFTDGLAVGHTDVLVEIGAELGIDRQEIREMLDGDRFAEDVRGDEATAQSYGISGVPFFVIEKKWGISGAQPTELFLQALSQAWNELHAATPR